MGNLNTLVYAGTVAGIFTPRNPLNASEEFDPELVPGAFFPLEITVINPDPSLPGAQSCYWSQTVRPDLPGSRIQNSLCVFDVGDPTKSTCSNGVDGIITFTMIQDVSYTKDCFAKKSVISSHSFQSSFPGLATYAPAAFC